MGRAHDPRPLRSSQAWFGRAPERLARRLQFDNFPLVIIVFTVVTLADVGFIRKVVALGLFKYTLPPDAEFTLKIQLKSAACPSQIARQCPPATCFLKMPAAFQLRMHLCILQTVSSALCPGLS